MTNEAGEQIVPGSVQVVEDSGDAGTASPSDAGEVPDAPVATDGI